ncbi:BTB/POZ and MATH domain-containing protein 2 [Rhynchospora pubera]|uniref:BTB/POZ and MATH domain-containing protein 2 n=1 Tax=Rhynchospora pubera TaxID=906938 RepID=A0AAV8BR29_9POAL|nr:BTB/POZ and MATH domain-containing protein 2 [Rhynchospora pubera]
MGSFCEGIFTVHVKDFSELASHGEANEALLKQRCFERMHFAKYGPYTVGDMIKVEVRMYPVGGNVQCHVCLLSHADLVNKFCCDCLFSDPKSNNWKFSIIRTSEKVFKADTIGAGLGLPMVQVDYFQRSYWDNSALFKLVLWFILDDSKDVPIKPNQPKVCSPDLTAALLTGEFADIRLVVDGQTFPAHRAVLAARSSVFRSEFLALQDDLCQNGVFVSIQRRIDAFTFQNLMHFVYTDSVLPAFDEPATSSRQRYRRLFIAAHLFKIEGLKKLCEEKLTVAVAECILSALELIDFEDSGLLKIVQKDCDKKPEILITSTTNEPKVGDRLYGTSMSK